MRFALLTTMLIGLAAATPASALTSVDFSFASTSRSSNAIIAQGQFTYADGLTGVLGFNNLASFNITLYPNTNSPTLGTTYTLASISGFNDYRYFAYDTAANNFLAANIGGINGSFASVLSAQFLGQSGTADDLGFFFSPVVAYTTTMSFGVGRELSANLGRMYTSSSFSRLVGPGGPIIIIPDPEGENPVIPVPEPTTWAMLITGFGLVGATMRRRRSNAAPA